VFDDIQREARHFSLHKTCAEAVFATTLVCGENPSRTCATSRIYVVAPFCVFTGRPLISAIVSGCRSSDLILQVAILAVPEGKIRFWALMALTTSTGGQSFGLHCGGIDIHGSTRCLPP